LLNILDWWVFEDYGLLILLFAVALLWLLNKNGLFENGLLFVVIDLLLLL
jgi:hypothetical protein